jgi:hypothetical protein
MMNSKNRSRQGQKKLSTRGVRLDESLDAALTQTQTNHGTASWEQEPTAARGRENLETLVPAENSGKKNALSGKSKIAESASAELLRETRSNEEGKIANHTRTKLGRMDSTPK